MNEQAIIDSYNLFVQNGYKKSLQEYKQLLASNPNALNDSYGLFQQNGYKKSLNEFKVLMGVGGAAPVAPSAQVPASGEVKKKKILRHCLRQLVLWLYQNSLRNKIILQEHLVVF